MTKSKRTTSAVQHYDENKVKMISDKPPLLISTEKAKLLSKAQIKLNKKTEKEAAIEAKNVEKAAKKASKEAEVFIYNSKHVR